jgi:CrcB protein
MFKNFLLVGLGGAFGSMARYGVSYLTSKLVISTFPFGTLIINVVGCFVIGILFGLSMRNEWLEDAGWLLLATGFCGGFTTFSTFALENIQMAGRHQAMSALLYTALSLVLGLVLCRLGIRLAQ